MSRNSAGRIARGGSYCRRVQRSRRSDRPPQRWDAFDRLPPHSCPARSCLAINRRPAFCSHFGGKRGKVMCRTILSELKNSKKKFEVQVVVSSSVDWGFSVTGGSTVAPVMGGDEAPARCSPRARAWLGA